jgi:hypothetical protein
MDDMTNVVVFPHEKLRKHLIEVLNGFDSDPADTPYQEGYEDALRELYRVFFSGR